MVVRSEMGNPYLDECRTLGIDVGINPMDQGMGAYVQAATSRGDMVNRYSWAIPTPGAIAEIARHSPGGVVEVGAGGGYWSMLLRAAGVDVLAFDPDGGGEYFTGSPWTDVADGDEAACAAYPGRTLLLCWPEYGKRWPASALLAYTGDVVAYVGEGPGGCTGDDVFHRLLGSDYCTDHGFMDYPDPERQDGKDQCPVCLSAPIFEEISLVEIPQWPGTRDHLYIYRRIGRPAMSLVSSGAASSRFAALERDSE